MLLGSPPDMIRGYPLRETGPAAAGGGQVRENHSTTKRGAWQLFFGLVTVLVMGFKVI